MANYISKVKLPDNSEYTLKDGTINGIYFVLGTQTSVTGTWTGVLDKVSALTDGLTIAYYLPYRGSGNATLNLTLADSSTTGAIECYYTAQTRLTTHYDAGSVILLTYITAGKPVRTSDNATTNTTTDRWVRADYDSNSNYYDRRLHNNYIKAVSAITAKRIIYGNTTGYQHIAAGSTINLAYPILYATAAIAANTQASNTYEAYPGVKNTAFTGAAITLTANSQVYIVGSYSASTGLFTVESPVATCSLTSGKYYIPLGVVANNDATLFFFAPQTVVYYYNGTNLRQVGDTVSVTQTKTSGIEIGSITVNGTATKLYQQDTTYTFDGTYNASSNKAATVSTVTNATSSLAPKASPALTGTPTAPTATAGTNTTQIATTAFVTTAVANSFAANDAMLFKGTIGSSGATVTALPASHNQGWTYKVITAGTYAGVTCEIGDMIICITDGTSANDAHWTVVQSNIDGAVTGPASSTDAHIATFNGTSGKVIKDSGYTIATSVPANAKFTDTTYSSKTAASGGTDVSLVTTGEKYTWNNKSNLAIGTTASTAAAGNHTHTLSLATDSGTSSISLAANTKYKLSAGGSTYVFTTPADTNTTYSAGTGLSLSGTTINHSNSVTAGTAGTSSATSGSTLAVPYVTYDAQGHITATGTHTHTVSGFLTSHQTIKQDGVTGATVNRYGACTTAAATAAKMVSVTTGTFSLEAGARVSVKFNNANTANTPTLNVNSTGAKNIFHKGAQITSGSNTALLAGICDFIYDGMQWHLVGNYIDTNTDSKLAVTEVNSGTSYYPILGNSASAATRQYDSTGFVYHSGTETSGGVSYGYSSLEIGNSIASGTTGNKFGELTLYATGNSSTTLRSTQVDNISPLIMLPPASGTLALTSDLEDYAALNHTHNLSLAAMGTSTINLSANTVYTLTAGGETLAFKTPADSNTWTALSTSAAGYVAKAPNDTAKFLRGDASWAALPTASTSAAGIIQIGTTATTAAAGNHTHTLSLTATGTSTVNLSANTVYTLTAGGNSVVFKTPADSNTDTKLTLAAVTSGTTYYPVVGKGTSAATRQFDTTGMSYAGTNGTASTVGSAKLTLGNSTASGTANNKQGQLILYGSTAYAHTIVGAPTAARTITLPDKTGTVALTSDLVDSIALVVDCGTISSLPVTKNATGVLADMIVTHYEFSTPSAFTSDLTVTTAAGKVTLSGSISGSSTVKLTLMRSTSVTGS